MARTIPAQSRESPMRKVLGKPEYQSDYLRTYDRRLPPLHNPELGAFLLLPDNAMADHAIIHKCIKDLEGPDLLAIEFFPSLRVLEMTFQSTNFRDELVRDQ